MLHMHMCFNGSLIRFGYEDGEHKQCPEGDRRITSQPSALQAAAHPGFRGVSVLPITHSVNYMT